MKKITQLLLVVLVATGALFTSCVKDEADNIEADIISATIEGAKELLIVDPGISKDQVDFRLISEPESYTFAPTFTLSKGATISPESGTPRDFTEPQKYTVTAEDGVTTKVYTVRFFFDEGILLNYSFDDADVNETGKFHEFYVSLPNGVKRYDWSSGNVGFQLMFSFNPSLGDKEPSKYPTVHVDNGYKGKGVMLETRSTGGLSLAPLAAGNFFLGDFKTTFPTIKSTKFGQPFTYNVAPAAVKGWFKYKAGEEFEVNKEPSELKKDTWDAYAILFEKSDKDNFLTGDHDFKDARLISVAKLDDAQRIETEEWKEFEIKFENVAGKSFSADKEYMFTIVFSSSKEGDKYNGAVGSRLYIDEVEIILQE